jgi:hypothetical protein
LFIEPNSLSTGRKGFSVFAGTTCLHAVSFVQTLLTVGQNSHNLSFKIVFIAIIHEIEFSDLAIDV